MKKKKKSSFWTGIFSLMPGAVEMYYGFMKMGLSIMLIFFATIAITAFFESGILSFFIVIAWFYGFFHARNFAGLTDEELLNIPDEYVIDVNRFFSSEQNIKLSSDIFKRKIVQYGIIFVGITMLWQGVLGVFRCIFPHYGAYYRIFRLLDLVPRFVFSIAIVWFGCYLIQVKKDETAKVEESVVACSSDTNAENNIENNVESNMENTIDNKEQSL